MPPTKLRFLMGAEHVKSDETDSYSDLMSAFGASWVIRARVGILGGVGR